MDPETINVINREAERQAHEGAFTKEYTYEELLKVQNTLQVVKDILGGSIKIKGFNDPLSAASQYVEDIEASRIVFTIPHWDEIRFQTELFKMLHNHVF